MNNSVNKLLYLMNMVCVYGTNLLLCISTNLLQTQYSQQVIYTVISILTHGGVPVTNAGSCTHSYTHITGVTVLMQNLCRRNNR